jgi:RepB DNA-primase from phage plasmid
MTNVLPFPSREHAVAVATDFDMILTVYKDGVEHAVAIHAVNPQRAAPNPSMPNGNIFKIDEFPGVTMRLELVASAASPENGIPFMVTNAMKADLARRGFSPEQVSNMTPAGARRIVSGGELIKIDDWIASSLASAAKAGPSNAVLADEVTVRKFLEIINAQAKRAIGDAEKPGVLQISRLHPNDDILVPSRFAISEVEQMTKAAVGDAAAGHNVYIEGRTVRADLKGSKRGSIADTEWVFAFTVDSDNDKGKAGIVTAEASLIVESGGPGNFHYWYFLDRAVTAAQAKETGNAIKAASGADANTGVITQPYRIAGTPNFPNATKRERGRVVAETRIIAHSGKLWTASELLDAFKAAPNPDAHKESSKSGNVYGVFSERRWQTEDSLPKELLKLIVDGVRGEDEDRSTEFFRVVGNLKRRYWTLDAIVALFEKYPEGVAAKYAIDGRIRDETERAYNKVTAPYRPELPTIGIVKGNLTEIVQQVEDALSKAGVPIFERSNEVVYPDTQKFDAGGGRETVVASLSRFTPDVLRHDIDRSANFCTWVVNRKTGELDPVPTDPPKDITNLVLNNKRYWPHKPVSGVITTPLLRPDGTLLGGDVPHYDPATRLYYSPGLKVPPIADKPTREDALAALDLYNGLLDEFPFIDTDSKTGGSVSKSVALSALLTPLARPAMDVAPMHLFVAHTAGSGKSYLVEVASMIATGAIPAVASMASTEEELEKRLSSLIMRGAPIISLDNANRDIEDSVLLCQMLTQARVSLRILSRSEMPEYDCRATVFATGNNVNVVGDLTRRTLPCHLDRGVERPELHSFELAPVEMVKVDRGRYVAAGLIIIKAYIAAGAPVCYSPLASYGQFSRFVRGPLIWLGQPDPAASMDAARAADPVTLGIRQLLSSGWLQTDMPYRARDIIERAANDTDLKELLERAAGDNRGEISNKRVGHWLKSICGRVVDGKRLMTCGTKQGSVQYVVQLVAG